jgi:hypothetical protein
MKQLHTVLFVLITLFFTSTSSFAQDTQDSKEKGEITTMIKDLAMLTDMADACGEHMNYYGKKALEGEVCKKFDKAFHDKWPSRAALQDIVLDYSDRLHRGEYVCESCEMMLQRVDELRITITYYLDYMDFVKEF